MHSEAFRKLEYKTQVFPFGEGLDVTRTRLTHTLEVSQIAQAICVALGLNDDLARASEALAAIILDRRHRRERMEGRIKGILGGFPSAGNDSPAD